MAWWRKWLGDVVGKVVRMAWFVQMRVAVVEEVVGVVVGGWSKITIAKEKWLPQRSQPG